MSGALAGKTGKEMEKGRQGGIGQTVVKRYWPGKKPDWVKEDDPGSEVLSSSDEEEDTRAAVAPPVIVKQADDPRLKRLLESRRPTGGQEEGLARRRDISTPQVVSVRKGSAVSVEDGASGSDGRQSEEESEDLELSGDVSDEESEEEDEEVLEAKRAAVRARYSFLMLLCSIFMRSILCQTPTKKGCRFSIKAKSPCLF
jgi:microfibrillar-associated protein 1